MQRALERSMDGHDNGEERFRATFEQAAAGLSHLAPDGRWLEVNDRLCRITGYTREEMTSGMTFQEITHPEDLEINVEQARRLWSGEIPTYSIEKRYLRKDDSTVWVDVTASVARGPSGDPAYIIAVIEDISARKRAEEGLRFLAETGAALSSSLDYRATLANVARLAVPTLADWCAVDVLEGDSVERLAVEHEDPAKIAMALELQERYPPETEASSAVLRVLKTGRSEFYPEVGEEMLEAAAHDEEHLRLLRELGFTSVIMVPMVARGRTLGVVTLVTAESRRMYASTDLELAEELARRAALAVDNATLYEEAQREIAERERAQAELRVSRDELEVILGGVTDGVTAQDPTGRLFYANETAARIVGYPSGRALVEAPPREVLEKFEILDGDGRPFPLDDLPGRRALRGEEGAEAVLRFRILATGEERWSVVNAAPIFQEDGEIRMVVNIFRDITESKRSEEERARLAAIVESSEDIIIGKTLDGTITSWNKGAERIYGYSAEEAVGRPISMLVPSDRPNEIPKILESIRRGEKVDNFDTVRVTKDGRRRDISLTVSPIKNRSGEIVGASTIARDITERRRIDEALREIRETERRRIARDLHDGVLQDLSYTAAAMGLIMLEMEDPDLEPRLQKAVDAIRRAGQELRDAVNDLRIGDERGRPFLELVEAQVRRNQAMARGCEISLEVEDGFPREPFGKVESEPLRIIQEALTNARRHSGASRVLVTLKKEGEDLVAEVSDDGVGFGAENVPGVGMSSMRERAAAIGGRLLIESSPGQGTSVQLRVPMKRKG